MTLPLVTKDEVLAVDWQHHLKDAKEPTCSDYSRVLLAKAAEADAGGAEKEAAVLRFLGELCGLALRPDKEDRPFSSQASSNTWRTCNLDDFSDEQVGVVAELVSSITDPELRARCADVSWCRRKDYRMASTAVSSYLESAAVIQKTSVSWPTYLPSVERATFLALSIGDPSRQTVLDYLHQTIDVELAAANPSFYSAKILALLLKFKAADAVRSAAAAEGQAKIAECVNRHDMAEVYWDLATKWNARAKNEVAAHDSRKRSAESKVREAETATSRSYGAAAGLMAEAIEMYRRIKGERPRIEQLQRQMLDYQQRSLQELGKYSVPFNVQDMATQAVEAVRGKTLKEALGQLALICMSPSVDTLRAQVEKVASGSISSFFATSILDHQGKVIGRRPALRGAQLQQDEDAVSCQMYSEATQHRALAVSGFIDPARHEILKVHRPSQSDLEFLVRFNPFVPPGREYTFLRGIYAGIEGDFVVAVNLLIPQLENSIRTLMTQAGIVTSTVDNNGIQQDRDLNTLLYDKGIEQICDKDLTFDLRGLLIHRFGSNLRNRMAHGLLFDGDYYAPPGRYLWWLMLRFLCTPLIQVNAANIRASSDTPDAGAQTSTDGDAEVKVPATNPSTEQESTAKPPEEESGS